MRVVKLGDIFTIARGGSPRPIKEFITESPDGINWIMIGDAKEGEKFISSTAKRITPKGVSRSRMVNPGDFLLTNSMSFGHPYILKTSGCIHDGWLVLTKRTDDIHEDYFYHLLGSPTVYRQFAERAAGAVVKNLNIEIVSDISVPLPPLPEQKRIADILDKADAIRRKRAQALELTDQFLQSVFLDMFGDPVTNPKGWEETGIEEICELIVDCVNRTAPVVPGPTDYKMIRTTNVRNGIVDLSTVRYVTKETFDTWNRRATPRPGDVLLTREAPVGEAGILRSEENVFLGQRLMLYRPDQSQITSEYLLYSFRGPYLQKQFDANGSGSTVKHLPLPVCRSLRVFRPPIELQNMFTRAVSHVRAVRMKQSGSEAGSDELFSSCVQRAFRGEL